MRTQNGRESRTAPFLFDQLEPDGSNYTDWNFNIRATLCADENDTTLELHPEDEIPPSFLWAALLLMRRHMDPSLRMQYIAEESPARLWHALKARFEHEETIFLPRAQADWSALRVLDFPNFSTYDSELHRIVAQLRLCGITVTEAELINKTLNSFPPACAILSQQYRNMKFTKYSDLMRYLQIGEQQQQILLQTAEKRPAKEIHNSEVKSQGNSAATPTSGSKASKSRNDRETHNSEAPRRTPKGNAVKPRNQWNKPNNRNSKSGGNKQGQSSQSNQSPPRQVKGNCHKCGRPGHYARECRSSEYLQTLYKELQALKGSKRETHTLDAPSLTLTELDPENYMVNNGSTGIEANIALLDSASTHTILQDQAFFEFKTRNEAWQTCDLITIAGKRNFRFREGRAHIVLPGGTPLICERAMYAPGAPRSLISYRDLRANEIQVSTAQEKGEEVLELRRGPSLLAVAHASDTGLYELPIRGGESSIRPASSRSGGRSSAPQASFLTTNSRADLWHRRLGHPGTTMMRRMIPLLGGHDMCSSDAEHVQDCSACIQGKLIRQPSKWKLPSEMPAPLFRLHGDWCGPITPESGQFKYFFVLVDASGRHAEVSLLTTRNMVFPKTLAMLLKFRNHYPDYPVCHLRMDNALKFKSQAFEDFCTATGIELSYSVPYEHSQNGLAEAFIKKIQLVVRPMLCHANLPSQYWGHAVLHAATLLRLRPTLLQTQTPLELASGRTPMIAHLRTFGCEVWVPVSEPKLKTMEPQRVKGIYLGFDSPSIVRYKLPHREDIYKARFQNCKFIETRFPGAHNPTKPRNPKDKLNFRALETLTLNPDPRTALTDTEVRKLLDLQSLAEKVPDGFQSGPRILRSPVPGAGNPVPSKPTAKKQKTRAVLHVDHQNPEELSEIPWDDHESFVTRLTNLEAEPTSLDQAKKRPDWPKWELAIQAEYNSLRKRAVFGPLVTNLKTQPIGHKLVFTRKRDENGNVLRYKVRLVAQGFTQKPGVDFEQTYSPVMDSTSFRYLLSLAVQLALATRLMDVVTAYLYGDLDTELHIKPPPGFLPQLPTPQPGQYSGLKICKALYGLKQAGRAWYHHLKGYLITQGFTNHPTLPCVFVLKSKAEFVILAVYVDDLNSIGTPNLSNKVEHLLTKQFEMKILGRTTFCLGLQIKYCADGSLLLHQQTYTRKLLRTFNMDAANALSAPMIGKSKTEDDPYRPSEPDEEEVEKRQYLATVGALLYLATNTRPDISFAVSVLARHSQRPTTRHWQGVKHLLRYLRGTEDLGLHFKRGPGEIVGYADSGFKTDPASGKSQTGWIFLKNGAPISWRSSKQTTTATSTNHAELLAFYEAARESVWLRTMQAAIAEMAGLSIPKKPTVIFEDNAACIEQVSSGFIKSDRVKHINPHIFGYTQELTDSRQIEIRKVASADNVADVLTKALPAPQHRKLIAAAGMKSLAELP